MNPKPIEEAHDIDLRNSNIAIKRAARKARDVAMETGTSLVISKNGVIMHLSPEEIASMDSNIERSA